jgi:hypothetical protein
MGSVHVPTEETKALVKERSGLGQTQEAISRKLRIDLKTLRKYYREELDSGIEEANAEVANAMWLAATGRQVDDDGKIKRVPVNSTLSIWWSKTRMGYKEARDPDAANGTNELKINIVGGIGSVQQEPPKTNGHDTETPSAD